MLEGRRQDLYTILKPLMYIDNTLKGLMQIVTEIKNKKIAGSGVEIVHPNKNPFYASIIISHVTYIIRYKVR